MGSIAAVDVTAAVPEGVPVARGVWAGAAVPDAERLRLDGFSAGPGATAWVTVDGVPTLLVGLGDPHRLDGPTLRRASGAMARAATVAGRLATTLLTDVGERLPAASAAAAVVSGALGASYRFDTHRSRPSDRLQTLQLVAPGAGDDLRAAVHRAVLVAGGRTLARDLVNEPAGTLTAPEFARRCEPLAGGALSVVVHDESAIERLGMGGLLGVNRGSEVPARFVELHFRPEAPTGRRLGLVGKGITFDSGGIHQKTKASVLNTMKSDMGGAAAIVGAMSVLGALGCTTEVHAFLPLTDNMGGGDATRPGDVLRLVDGTTVEVVDTDAEGRLVLGDGLGFARAQGECDVLVSVATLTGTAIHAVGMDMAALVGNDQAVVDAVKEASSRTADRVWQLPRVTEYRPLLRSAIADMTNRSEAPAATSFAALFLEAFVGGGVPWAHLDMASCVLSDRDTDDGPTGARGWGVELLVELIDVMGRAG